MSVQILNERTVVDGGINRGGGHSGDGGGEVREQCRRAASNAFLRESVHGDEKSVRQIVRPSRYGLWVIVPVLQREYTCVLL